MHGVLRNSVHVTPGDERASSLKGGVLVGKVTTTGESQLKDQLSPRGGGACRETLLVARFRETQPWGAG